MNDEPNLREMWAKAKATQKRYIDEGETAHLTKMRDGYNGLKACGWKEIIYCPKDGTRFLAVGASGHEPRPCYYSGEWPNGSWWIEDAGDLWPANPALWKPMP